MAPHSRTASTTASSAVFAGYKFKFGTYPQENTHGKLDLTKRNNRSEQYVNGYMVDFITNSIRRGETDEELWISYCDYFEGWKKEDFELAHPEAWRDLRNFLRENGVFTPKRKGVFITQELPKLLGQEEFYMWSAKEIRQQQQSGRWNSRQLPGLGDGSRYYKAADTPLPAADIPLPAANIPLPAVEIPLSGADISLPESPTHSQVFRSFSLKTTGEAEPSVIEHKQQDKQQHQWQQVQQQAQQQVQQQELQRELPMEQGQEKQYKEQQKQENQQGQFLSELAKRIRYLNDPDPPLYGREISNLIKAYKEEMKYGGSKNSFEYKLRLFVDMYNELSQWRREGCG